MTSSSSSSSSSPLSGKVITITGAASGIGLATAHLLASRGATISISDLRPDALDSALSSLKSSIPSAEVFSQVVDVTKREDVEKWIDATVAKYGKLHGAANIAGIFNDLPGKFIQDSEDDEKDWRRILDVNLNGVFYCLRRQLKIIEGGGSVVNMASILGVTGLPGHGAYTASKHAIIGLTKVAAKEVSDRGIRVNAVAPGYVDTPALRRAGVTGENFDLGPRLNRMAQAEEVASVVAFLLGDESKYMTGSTYTIDGGLTA